MAQRVIAVVFGKVGGLSDCGAYAALHAFKDENVQARIIALSNEEREGPYEGVNVDVKDKAEKQRVHDEFKSIDVISIDVNSEDAQAKLESAFDGAEAVVSSFGNRQPFMSRHLETGSRKIVGAMENKGVNRLVQLSSFGIGEQLLPRTGIVRFWGCLLSTLIRRGRGDLIAMEQVVRTSKLDYLLIRPVGVDPGSKPSGSWETVSEFTGKPVGITVAKSDAGLFMLQQALTPTFHKTALVMAGKKA